MAIQQTRRALEPSRAQQNEMESGAQPRGRHYTDRQSRSEPGAGTKRLATGLGWFSIGLGLAELIAPRGLSKLIGLGEERTVLLRLMGLREIASGVAILTQDKPAGALWSRVAGDALDLSLLGAALSSDEADKDRVLIAAAAVVGVTALDVLCAERLSSGDGQGINRVKTITINRQPEELYRFWRNFENLPRFMSHLESVQVMGDKRSHWVAKGPAGTSVEWDAEIIEDRPNELIRWRSLEGADVENAGYVSFERAPAGRGTIVRVEVAYNPPAGGIGAFIASLFGEEPEQQIKGDLYRFKQVMETGEVVHSDASIHKWMHPAQPPEEGEQVHVV